MRPEDAIGWKLAVRCVRHPCDYDRWFGQLYVADLVPVAAMTPPASSQHSQPAGAKPQARRGLPSLAPLKRPIGYTHEQVPAFLPAEWQQRYLPAATTTIAERYLRRVASIVLVQHAEQCTAAEAASLLGLSEEPVLTAYHQVDLWVRHNPDGAALPRNLRTLATHLTRAPTKVNYHARRQALNRLQIPADD